MPLPVADDDHKRRARRRLTGAIALAIIAVIILPLVLEEEPPPAELREIHMPPPAAPEPRPVQNSVEYAPAPGLREEAQAEPPAPAPPRKEPQDKKPEPPRDAPASTSAPQPGNPSKDVPSSTAYTLQVGVFTDKANVLKLQSRIEGLGLQFMTEEIGDSTRVRVGSFSSREEAEAALAKLTAAGIKARVFEK